VTAAHRREHLGIVELAELCARRRAADLERFVRLAEWVTDADDPMVQRLFAEASHRHAWHAQLWADRQPAIPARPTPPATTTPPPSGTTGRDRVDVYRGELDELIAELAAISSRLDTDLDPSTQRTIDLVATDLRSLRSRLERS
jgi:hypothetical protein